MDQQYDSQQWLVWMDELAEQDFVVIDHFLDPDVYHQIQSFFQDHLSQFTQAGIGALDRNTIEKDIRGDRTYWLDRVRDESLSRFWLLVDETISMFNRYCYLSLSGYEFHLAHYPSGGHYDTHLDQFENRNNRMISIIIYLNDGWQVGDGGELEIVRPDDSRIRVEPIANRCVLFKSADVPHGVVEAFKSRYSLTGWLLYQPSALGKFLT